ncbi:MAG: four-carbon acid sugar kinase family protein [Oscillospiraceae bacterium]
MENQIKLLIIADDLTGALDTGVQLSDRGIPALVTTDLDFDFTSSNEVEALVFDTESRHIPPQDAYDIVLRIVSAGKRRRIPYIYKKTDSTLRGNIGSELSALIDASGERPLPFAPAWPENHRTIRDGTLFVDGVPLAETVFANDPLNPMTSSSVADIIAQTSSCTIKAVPSAFCEAAYTGPASDILLFDAETGGDMDRIISFLQEEGAINTAAGCARFAQIYPSLIDPGRTRSSLPVHPVEGGAMLLSGSLNTVSKKQAAWAAENLGFSHITVGTAQLMSDAYFKSPEGLAYMDNLAGKFTDGGLVVRPYENHTQSDSAPPVPDDIAARFIAAGMGRLAKNLLDRMADVGTLIVFGGDTLICILRCLGVPIVRPLTQVTAGVVFSQIDYGGRMLNLITKAGGFGDDSLVKIVLDYVESPGAR